MELNIHFSAILSDDYDTDSLIPTVEKEFTTVISFFQKVFRGIHYELSFSQEQFSEEDIISQSFHTLFHIHIQWKLTQPKNYHYALLLFQGYLGLLSSADWFRSPKVEWH